MENEIKKLSFEPFWGLSSGHIQTILPTFMPSGRAPPSDSWVVSLKDGDKLSCEVSTPKNWVDTDPTIFLIHGLGGNHASSYMIRMSRKLYQKGNKVIRINLRGCGSGHGLAKKTHYGGNSQDVLEILETYQKWHSNSSMSLVGFSLGGNISLKLAGELGDRMTGLLKTCIAICPPLDLFESIKAIEKIRFYQRHYLKSLNPYVSHKFTTLFDLDHHITAPMWGYQSAMDYYQNCSSVYFIPKIRHSTRVLLTEDDPFIEASEIKKVHIPPSVKIYTTDFGGHLGLIGKKGNYWMDDLILHWIEDKFYPNEG